MVEIVRYTKIYAEDIDFGDGTKEILLGNGQTVTLNQVNISHLLPGLSNGRVLFQAGNEVTQDSVFLYDEDTNILSVPSLAGGAGSGDDLALDSTTHATKGHISLQPTSGGVVIGAGAPSTKLHLKAVGACVLTIENTDAGTEADPAITFKIADTAKWTLGTDDSDGDKFMIDVGASLGSVPSFTLTTDNKTGINEPAPLGALHVKWTDAGAVTPAAAADTLIVEDSVDAGISILTPAANIGSIYFASTTAPNNGTIKFDHANSRFDMGIAGTDRWQFRSQGAIGINNSANASNPRGITINITQSVEEIISGKMNGIVAHGMTELAETDTACALYPRTESVGSSQGGGMLVGYSEGAGALELYGYVTSAATAKAAANVAAVMVNAGLKSTTTATSVGANGNLFAVRNFGASVFFVDTEGDVHVDGASTLTVFDDHDDVQLLSTIKALGVPDMRAKLGDFFHQNLRVLSEGGVVTVNEDGHHFISYKGLNGLLIDAIRQLSGKLAEIERRIPRLTGGSSEVLEAP
jgi:hypothetical protein